MIKDKISERVKLNKRYLNNEDLLDSFVDLTYEKISSVVDSINDEEILINYIDKIASKSIIEVLQANNRYRCNNLSNRNKIDYSIFNYKLENFNPTKYSISKLAKLFSTLKKIDENNNSSFLDVIMLRYKDNNKICNIAKAMELSEEEVANILFDMADYASKVSK